MPKVYIVSKGYHDWSAAERFGKIIFLARDQMERTSVSFMLRTFIPKMRGSKPDDFIVVTGLTVMCVIAAAIFVLKHKRLNLLLWNAPKGDYEQRLIPFDDIELEKNPKGSMYYAMVKASEDER